VCLSSFFVQSLLSTQSNATDSEKIKRVSV
jgi:hypothetical protein